MTYRNLSDVCATQTQKLPKHITPAEPSAASLEKTTSRVFWAAMVINNLITIGTDASNDFAEAPAPIAPVCVYADLTVLNS